MFWKRFFILLSFNFILPILLTAQNIDLGGTIGVSLTFGTQVNRIGVIAKGYATYNRFQLNAQTVNFFNFRTFGIPKGGLETQNSLGLIYGFGQKKLMNKWASSAHLFL